jgi:hypothetical protein
VERGHLTGRERGLVEKGGRAVESKDILDQHGAGLRGGDRARSEAELLRAARPEAQADLAGLMALARRLQAALVAVEPPADFAAQLKAQLAAAAPAASAARRTQRLRWMAGVGGALCLAGLGFVGYRAAHAAANRAAALRLAQQASAPAPVELVA